MVDTAEIENPTDFDMDAAQESLSSELFPPKEEPEVVEEIIEEVVEEEPAEETPKEPKEPKESEEPEQTKEAPKSWKKEMHEKWSSLDPEIQGYIELRENQMKEGVELSKSDSDYGKTMRELTSPHSELFKAQGVDEKTAVQWLLNAHANLSNADPEQRVELFNKLAESYGVKLDGTKLPEEYTTLSNKVNELQTKLNGYEQRSLQEQRAKAESEVEAFASEHPYFDDVADDIIPFIHAGMSLEDAYEKAIWANPVTRQKEIDRIQKESEENLRKEEEEKRKKVAKAKSPNVRSLDTNKAPTEPLGSMEDTMRETLREIKNR